MYRKRLVISLSIFFVLILLQASLTFWAFQVLSSHTERSRSAQQMLTEIVHFRADAKRLKVWLADFIITEKRNTELRDELFHRMASQLNEVDQISAHVFLTSKYDSDPEFATQVSTQVNFLRINMNALKQALQTREIIQLESDAQRWQTLITLFDKFQGSDIPTLVNDLIGLHKAKTEQAEADAAAMKQLLYLVLGLVTLISLALFIGLSLFLTRYFNQSITALGRGAERFGKSDFSEKIPETGAKEFASLARGFNLMAQHLESARDQQRLLQDATEEKVLERTAQLQYVVNQLHDAELRQKGFIAEVTHELRTPTTIILGEAELALRSKELNETSSYLSSFQRIVDCCKTLSCRIDDLIMLSKGQHALVSVQLAPRSIVQLYDQLTQQAALHAAHHHIQLEVGNPVGKGPYDLTRPNLLVDSAKLDLVFNVIIENAIQYQTHDPYLALRCELRPQDVVFKVVDQGIGISADEKVRLFERHFRGEKAQALRPDGLGLGLSIAKNILDAHDGCLELVENSQKGTVAQIILPVFELESE